VSGHAASAHGAPPPQLALAGYAILAARIAVLAGRVVLRARPSV
jgi:hypothetical protein